MFKYLPAWMSVYYLCPGVYRDQRKMSESLKLSLQIAVSHHVGAGNRMGASGRAASHLSSLTFLAQERKSAVVILFL